MTILAWIILSLALIPALVFLGNLRLYRIPEATSSDVHVSILIPARNEETVIAEAVESALNSTHHQLEVIVLDDQSDDKTASIVEKISTRDSRVRLVHAPPLPEGWCGKQHACSVLATEAKHSILIFLDADVRLAPEGVSQMLTFLESSGADLVSGVPRQETTGLLEKLILPLIHFILLGFLPFRRMRRSTHPSYAAGCGQLFVARRDSYEKAGGHAAIRASLHDGITLPRAFRQAGLKTDLFDATETASCQMYQSGKDLWNGLTKNTTEGLGSSKMIVPITLLLIGGQVLPFVLLPLMWGFVLPLSLAVGFAWLPRWIAAFRFRQSKLGALLHPLGVILLITIQWHGLLRAIMGRPSAWKGRAYHADLTAHSS